MLKDDYGNIQRSYKGTALDGIVKENVPSEYTYSTKYDVYKNLADDSSMRERWGDDYDKLSPTEKYKAKELGDLGIANISLDTIVESDTVVASVNYTNGSSTKIGEFYFEAQLYNSKILILKAYERSPKVIATEGQKPLQLIAVAHSLMVRNLL
jgi:hypothetical protein